MFSNTQTSKSSSFHDITVASLSLLLSRDSLFHSFQVHEKLQYQLMIIQWKFIIDIAFCVYFLHQIKLLLSQNNFIWLFWVYMQSKDLIWLFFGVILKSCNKHFQVLPISINTIFYFLCRFTQHESFHLLSSMSICINWASLELIIFLIHKVLLVWVIGVLKTTWRLVTVNELFHLKYIFIIFILIKLTLYIHYIFK